jgi:hypothetical protein
MLDNPTEYENNVLPAKFAISCQAPPDSLLDVSAGTCQRTLVDELGMIRTQTGHKIDQKMVAIHATLHLIPPHNSNQ